MAQGETISGLLARIAELLGSKVLPAPPPTPPAPPPPNDYPFAANYLKVYGSTMHYLDVGSKDADPILFLHGNPSWSYLWRNIIPSLQPYGRCIAVDLMGFGMSDKPDGEYRFFDHARYLEGFIRRLDLKNITLVLHDWGTGLGFQYAMQNEDNVKGIAFMEALLKPYPDWDHFPRAGADPKFVQLFQLIRGKPHEAGWQFLVDSDDNWLNYLLLSVMGRQLTPAEIANYKMPFPDAKSRIPIWRLPNDLPIGNDPPDVTTAVEDYSRRLQRSKLPKLLLYSQMGVILNVPEKEWAEANLTELKVVELVDTGPAGPVHFLQERYPSQIGGALASWYQGL